MMKTNEPRIGYSQATRHGVTMSEVVIAMLIMGIGVVSLAAIFPASVLRSVQASQLTNAAILSKNASERLQFDQSVINSIPTIPGTTVYNRVIDPFAVLVYSAGSPGPQYLPATVGGIVSRVSGAAAAALTTQGQKIQFAENLASLPDSWSLIREDTVSGGYGGTRQVTLAAPATDFADINPRVYTLPAGAPLPQYRIVLTDPTGQFSAVRTIRSVTGNQISWLDPSGAANSESATLNFTPAKARIELRENRYTWMMTVRKRFEDATLTKWNAEVDLTVFFNRSYRPADEVTIQMSKYGAPGFDGAPGLAGVDDDLNGTLDDTSENNWAGSDDRRTLSYTGTKPVLLKKGGYLFDPTYAFWYRVVNIDEANGRVLVDRDLVSVPAGPSTTAFVLMKGIVQVFQLSGVSGTN